MTVTTTATAIRYQHWTNWLPFRGPKGDSEGIVLLKFIDSGIMKSAEPEARVTPECWLLRWGPHCYTGGLAWDILRGQRPHCCTHRGTAHCKRSFPGNFHSAAFLQLSLKCCRYCSISLKQFTGQDVLSIAPKPKGAHGPNSFRLRTGKYLGIFSTKLVRNFYTALVSPFNKSLSPMAW